MFSILDGREEFYQWDKDRKIIVADDSIKEVHFCNKTDDCSLVVETYKDGELTLANVPNILLTNYWKIRVFGYTGDFTKFEKCFKVNPRSKPADYIYTETEVKTFEELVAKTEEALYTINDMMNYCGELMESADLIIQEFIQVDSMVDLALEQCENLINGEVVE